MGRNQLQHGDPVVVDIMFGMAHHWAIFDKENDVFIELSRDPDSYQGKIFERTGSEWMKMRKGTNPRRVVWEKKFKSKMWEDAVRSRTVANARKRIGEVVPYTLLARFNDP